MTPTGVDFTFILPSFLVAQKLTRVLTAVGGWHHTSNNDVEPEVEDRSSGGLHLLHNGKDCDQPGSLIALFPMVVCSVHHMQTLVCFLASNSAFGT